MNGKWRLSRETREERLGDRRADNSSMRMVKEEHRNKHESEDLARNVSMK